jgi:monoterpene epsilon-lactone hydrolase
MVPVPSKQPKDADALQGRTIPARTVPLPTVSPELRKVMAGATRGAFSENPQDVAEWQQRNKVLEKVAAMRARRTWRQLGIKVVPTQIAGVSCFRLSPPIIAPARKDWLLVQLHHGGFVFNGGAGATREGALIAASTRTVTISIDYRQGPDSPFPAALNDTVAVLNAVMSEGYAPRTALLASSTGALLALASLLELKGRRLALPGALFLGSPCVDLTKTGDSYYANEDVDGQLSSYDGLWGKMLHAYAGGRDLEDPLVSPIHGDFSGFPPTLLVSGTRDLLLSDTVRAHRKLRQAGVSAELHVFEAQSHREYAESHPSPESQDALAEIGQFLDRHLAR